MPSRRRRLFSKSPQQSSHHCKRPLIPLGRKIKTVEQKFSPITNKISRPLNAVQSRLTMLISKVLSKLRLQCLVPKLFMKLQPLMSRISCKLGLNDDGFMEVPSCNSTLCSKFETEEREISRHLDAPILDVVDLSVRTFDECSRDMSKVTYGSRILAKLVDDQSCNDPRFTSFCDELFGQKRIIMQETCESIR